METIQVKCPDCQTILIVDRKSGKVVETRKPILEETTGDRFKDAFEKVRRASDRVESKFEEARKKEKNKLERLNAIFDEGLKKAKEEGPVTKPQRDIDLD